MTRIRKNLIFQITFFLLVRSTKLQLRLWLFYFFTLFYTYFNCKKKLNFSLFEVPSELRVNFKTTWCIILLITWSIFEAFERFYDVNKRLMILFEELSISNEVMHSMKFNKIMVFKDDRVKKISAGKKSFSSLKCLYFISFSIYKNTYYELIISGRNG